MTLVERAELPPSLVAGREDADLDAALSWASSQVEAYCGRRFASVEVDTVMVDPLHNRSAYLPDPPVSAVSSVQALLPHSGGWVELTNYAWTVDGLIYDTTGLPGTEYDGFPTWPVLPKSLQVTYSHGYTNIPQPVRDAVIQAVRIYLTNPDGLLSKRVDDVQYTWSRESLQNSGIDANLLDEYRLVTIA